MTTRTLEDELLEKLRALPPHKQTEVEDFIDFLCFKDEERELARAATKLSEQSFAGEWNNADDADYDRL